MKTNIRRIFYTLTLALCITTTAGAQSFTQHLQEKKQAKGSVTVTQSKEIEDLVNKADVSAAKQEQQHVDEQHPQNATIAYFAMVQMPANTHVRCFTVSSLPKKVSLST